MRKVICIPTCLKGSFTAVGRYLPLLDRIQQELGYQITYADRLEPANAIITFKAPVKGMAPTLYQEAADLPAETLLVAWVVDLHQSTSLLDGYESPYRKTQLAILGRANRIVSPYPGAFKALFPQFWDKTTVVPHFIVREWFKQPILNPFPRMQCLISGHGGEYYPERGGKAGVNTVRLSGPGWQGTEAMLKLSGARIKESYATELRQYFAGLATPSVLKYPLAKHFEIPGAGALLFAYRIPDLDDFSFIPGTHYVDINQKDFQTVLSAAIKSPKQYEGIRREGIKHVWNSFTDDHAFNKIKEVLCLR